MIDKIRPQMPAATIETLARSVFAQARSYGFSRIDQVRLASALLSLCNAPETGRSAAPGTAPRSSVPHAASAPSGGPVIRSPKLDIHALGAGDPRLAIVGTWLHELFAAHFLVSAATAQPRDLAAMLAHPRNVFGLISLRDGRPIGLVAYLDRDDMHRRAEIRVLIGDPGMRRRGYAVQATRLWLDYGFGPLNLEKVFVQLPDGDVRSLRMFEQLGFSIEALLPGELCIAGERHDAIRCSILRDRGPPATGPDARLDAPVPRSDRND
jgi:RimJ/RimL family protein N-acetyltransferase